jgi:hypothetical protein
MDVCLLRPYEQIQNNIRLTSTPYGPYSGDTIGLTSVYRNGELLYTVDRFFSEYIAISDNGLNLFVINFRLNVPAISIYRHGVFNAAITLGSIFSSSVFSECIDGNLSQYGFTYWSKYHNDNLYFGESRKEDGILSKCINTKKIKSRRSKKLPTENSYIFYQNNSLYVLLIDNSYLKLSLESGKIERASLAIGNMYKEKNVLYKRYLAYKYLKRGNFPKLANSIHLRMYIEESMKKRKGISKDVKLNWSISISISIDSSGLATNVNVLVYNRNSKKHEHEESTYLKGLLSQLKYSTKSNPIGYSEFRYTNWNEDKIII